MGTVYAATDTVTGARVAVKIVSAAVAENEVLRNRFEREVRVVRALGLKRGLEQHVIAPHHGDAAVGGGEIEGEKHERFNDEGRRTKSE